MPSTKYVLSEATIRHDHTRVADFPCYLRTDARCKRAKEYVENKQHWITWQGEPQVVHVGQDVCTQAKATQVQNELQAQCAICMGWLSGSVQGVLLDL